MAFRTTTQETYVAPALNQIERPSQAILRLAIPPTPDLAGAKHTRSWGAMRQPTLAEWAEVRRLHTEGASTRVIARAMGVSRRSVRHILYPWQRS